MPSRKFPKILAALVVAIAVVNWLAGYHYWYWTMRWFDMPMHFAGGVWVAGVAVWWRYGRNESILQPSFRKLLATAVISAFGVGFLWEVFEAVASFMAVGHINEMADTLKDLLFDTLGGVAVAIFVQVRAKYNLDKKII